MLMRNFLRYLLAPLASPLQAALAYVVVLCRVIMAQKVDCRIV